MYAYGALASGFRSNDWTYLYDGLKQTEFLYDTDTNP